MLGVSSDWVLEYDGDDGPLRVGLFASVAHVEHYVSHFLPDDADYTITRLQRER